MGLDSYADLQTKGSQRALSCRGCGYELTGLGPEGNCPECGAPVSAMIGDAVGGIPSKNPFAVERSFAHDTTPDGTIQVGYYGTIKQAVRWEDGTMEFLSSSIDSLEEATAISSNGVYVVGIAQSGMGFIYGPDGISIPLGTLGSGATIPVGVSNDGQVVVGNSGGVPFLWTPINGMQEVRTILEVDFELDLSDWILSEVVGLSANGTTLTGNGTKLGDPEPWRAVLPRE